MSGSLLTTRDELSIIVNKVNLYLSVQRFDAAEKLLRAAIADHGDLAHLRNLMGLCFHRQSRFAEAVDEFRGAVANNPAFVEASLNLAATLCDLSRYDEAKEVFDQVQERTHPAKKQPDLILGRLGNLHAESAKLYHQSGMINDAIREYRKALSMFDRMPDVKLSLAQLYLQSNQLDKAQVELEEMTKSSPEVSEAGTWLGLVYLRQGKMEAARDQWLRVQQMDPNDLISRAYLRLTISKNKAATSPSLQPVQIQT